MRFAVSVQSEGALPAAFKALRDVEADVRLFHLTFGAAFPNSIFLPDSTWTEGRNRLLEAARLEGPFDYYIFADDDVVFERGGWQHFLSDLEVYRPAVGVPALYGDCGDLDVHAVYDFDAILTAFHGDLIEDGLILPYIADFDSNSWWLSQYFVIHLANALYPNGVVKLPASAIVNTKHRDYPRIDASRFQDFDETYFRLWRDENWPRRHFRTHFTTRSDPPFPPRLAASYRIPDDLRVLLRSRS